jgi:ATP dependent DNA ligase domain
MLATSADALPSGPEWTYEVKWDGYRAIAVKDGTSVRLLSRNAKDLTRDYPSIVRSLAPLRSRQVTLDGEIVALTEEGANPAAIRASEYPNTGPLHGVILAGFRKALERPIISWARGAPVPRPSAARR